MPMNRSVSNVGLLLAIGCLVVVVSSVVTTDICGAKTDSATMGHSFVGNINYPNAGMNRVASGFLGSPDLIRCAVIDSSGTYAYFASLTMPSKIVKLEVATVTVVSEVSLANDEGLIQTGIIDPTGSYAYFGTQTYPPKIIKFELSTMTRAGSLEVLEADGVFTSSAVDPLGRYGYFVSSSAPGRIIKLDLAKFMVASLIYLDETDVACDAAVIDPAGSYLYVATNSPPYSIIKVDLTTETRVSAIQLASTESSIYSSVITPAGDYAYFATGTAPSSLVKIDLASFQFSSILRLPSGDDNVCSAVMDPSGAFLYLGTESYPGKIIKVNLTTLTKEDEISLGYQDTPLRAAVMCPTGTQAFFGVLNSPGRIFSVGLTPLMVTEELAFRTSISNLNNLVFIESEARAYSGTAMNPATIVQLDLESMTVTEMVTTEGAVSLNAPIHDQQRFALYYGTASSPARIVKFDVIEQEVSAVLELNPGEDYALASALDASGDYAYYGLSVIPGTIVRIDLESFARDASIELPGVGPIVCGTGDLLHNIGYFVTQDYPPKILKINFDTFEFMASIDLPVDSGEVRSCMIDNLGEYLYLPVNSYPSRIVKVALATFTVASTLEFDPLYQSPYLVFADPHSDIGYVTFDNYPAAIMKLDLSTLTSIGSLPLAFGEENVRGYVLNTTGDFVTLLTEMNPYIVKIGLTNQRGVVQGSMATTPMVSECESISFFSHNADGLVRLAIYAEGDGGNLPYLVWQTTELTNTVTNDWLTVPIAEGTPSELTIQPGAYWLCWQADSREAVGSYSEVTEQVGIQWGQEFGAFAPRPVKEQYTTELWSIYVTYEGVEPTPTPSPELTPTPQGTATATPPVMCASILNQPQFCPGDLFEFIVVVDNYGSPFTADLFVVLDVYGEYWFFPSWTYYGAPDYPIDFQVVPLKTETTWFHILNFIWPETGSDSAADLKFLIGLLSPDFMEIYCYEEVSFGYGPRD